MFCVNAPSGISGQRELLVAVRLFCLMHVPCKVRSQQTKSCFSEQGKRQPYETMRPIFSLAENYHNFAPNDTLTDRLPSCSVQSSKDFV